MRYRLRPIETLVGITLVSVDKSEVDTLQLVTEGGIWYSLRHAQDCCEEVQIEDICGDFNDLVGSPIIEFSRRTEDGPDKSESSTWTFFHIATAKGKVVIRFYGTSNGYYSEDADLYEQTES